MNYKYILFDADETLLDFRAGERAAFMQSCEDCGVVFSDDIYSRYHEINDRHWKMLERGLTTRDRLKTQRFVDLFAECALGDENSAADFGAAFIKNLATQSILFPDSLSVVASLSRKYKLYIITNGIASVSHGRLDASPIRPYFEKLFISDEMGCSKPDPAFFDLVLRGVGDSDPSHYIVVGDSPTSDIKGAVCAGMDSILITWGKEYGDVGQTYTVNELENVVNILL